ncbi:MAG: hypothetical protein WA688_04615, partial [Thermoplasmata archaeon]
WIQRRPGRSRGHEFRLRSGLGAVPFWAIRGGVRSRPTEDFNVVQAAVMLPVDVQAFLCSPTVLFTLDSVGVRLVYHTVWGAAKPIQNWGGRRH